MRCRNCSAELKHGMTFCPMCGAVVSQKDGRPFSLVKAFLCGAAYIGIQFVCAIAFSVISYLFFPNMAETSAASDIVFIISGVVALAAAVLLFASTGRCASRELAIKSFPIRLLPLCAILGMSLQFVLSFMTSLVPWPRFVMLYHVENMSQMMSGNIVLTVLSSVVAAGIVEEVVFRALIIGRLENSFGEAASIVISALIFGAAHMSPVAFFYATLLGIILGYLFCRYRSVPMCATIHMFFNLGAIFAKGVSSPILYLALVFVSGALALVTLYAVLKYPHDGKM